MSKRSNIVAGAGLLTGIFTRLVAEVNKAGGDDDDIHRLTTPDADGDWVKIACIVANAKKRLKSLLVRISTILMPPGGELFTLDEEAKNMANVTSWTGRYFHDCFFGKFESKVKEAKLAVSVLTDNYKTITEDLDASNEITLCHVFALLTRQSLGQEGVLLIDGRRNIFPHVKCSHEDSFVMKAQWFADRRSWSLYQTPTTELDVWRAGSQVITADS